MQTTLLHNSHQLSISYTSRPATTTTSSNHQTPTLLYLHGLGCSKDDFAQAHNTPELSHCNIIALDFPGHGESPYPPDINLTIDDLVEITHIFTQELDLQNITLVGHSMGGLVALLLATKYPDQITKFINIEGNLSSEDCFFSSQVAATEYQTFATSGFSNFIDHVASKSNSGNQKYAATLRKYQPIKAVHAYAPSLVAYSRNSDLLSKFRNLPIPTLFIYGSENSHLSYIPQLQQAATTNPNIRQIAEVPNSNHFPQYDNPTVFYSEITRFFN